jgi:hypothetical protein
MFVDTCLDYNCFSKWWLGSNYNGTILYSISPYRRGFTIELFHKYDYDVVGEAFYEKHLATRPIGKILSSLRIGSGIFI